MEFNENVTTADIVKVHADLVSRYVKSNEEIYDAEQLMRASFKIAEETLNQVSSKIIMLSHARQFEVIELLEKIIALTYLTAVLEVIKLEQEQKEM